MISGNLASMLKDISAISCERINDGDSCLPWVKVGGVTVSGQKKAAFLLVFPDLG